MPDPTSSVIVAGARTPMGRLLGSLKDLSGSDLGAIAIRGALAKAGVGPELVEYVIMGQVLTAGAGQIPARQAAVAAGIPMRVPALTINKVCLSGIDAIALADQLIWAGKFDAVVAGGQESMSQAPHMCAGGLVVLFGVAAQAAVVGSSPASGARAAIYTRAVTFGSTPACVTIIPE